MAAYRSLDVPLEICYEIIDLLHDDKLALLSCALVCKAWVEYSRNHLWRDMHALRLHPDHDSWSSSPLKGSEDPEYEDITFAHWTISVEEATLFFSTRPHLAKLVRVLHLDGYGGLSLDALAHLVSAMPALDGFSLHRCAVLPPSEPEGAVHTRAPVAPAEGYRLRPIKLSFIRCSVVYRDYDTLFHVLNLFADREVPTLYLRGGSWNLYWIEKNGWVFDPDVDLKPGTKSLRLPVVRGLWIHEIVPRLFRYIFEETAMTRGLEELEIRPSYPSIIDTWSDFAMMWSTVARSAAASTLRSFDFFPGVRLGNACPAELTGLLDVAVRDAAQCSSLEWLCLGMNHTREHRYGDPRVGFEYYALFNAYCRILEGLPRNSPLEAFHLVFVVSHPTTPDSPGPATPLEVIKGCDWARLAALLTPLHRRRINMHLQFIIYPEVESREDLEKDLIAFFRQSFAHLLPDRRVFLVTTFEDRHINPPADGSV